MSLVPQTEPSRRPLRALVTLSGVLAAATAAGLALDDSIGLTGQAMLYVLAVAVAAYRLPLVAAVTCAVLAVGFLNYFFVSPKYTFLVDSPEKVLSLAAMLTVALSISHLGNGLRRETDVARMNARRARQLEELATELGSATADVDVTSVTQRVLATAFPGACTVALLSPVGELTVPDETPSPIREGLTACIREASVIGPGTGRWEGLQEWYIPLRAQGYTAGAACVRDAFPNDHAAREHAQAICTLAAHSLLRLRLSADMREAEERSSWHRAQSTFLAAISHDFRTPLAAIMGLASSLRIHKDKLPPEEQARLLDAIEAEALHLSALTENTLQLARLSHAGDLRMDWESIEEVVGSVLARIRHREGGGRVRARVPLNLPLVKADPVLLAQALENLLDNALKYSSDAIELDVARADQHLTIAVNDRGSGIARADEGCVFEPFRRGDHAGSRGSGLGLALCKAIARAHGGDLVFRPRRGAGGSFVLSLPVQPQPSSEEP